MMFGIARHIICALLCMLTVGAFAQVEVIYPDTDPVRVQGNTQQQRQASVAAPDTIPLPFFDDFTNPLIPVSSVINGASNTPVSLVTFQQHGLLSGDQVMVFGVKTAEYPAMNGVFYVKKNNAFQFTLHTGSLLNGSDSLAGNNSSISRCKWAKMPYDSLSINIGATPNIIKWVADQGTYINDRYPLAPPSYNVATFDGLNYSGSQYNSSNFAAQGFCDQLTSNPIDLSGLVPADSIYLSFFWQCGGIGELPETNDYIILEVKDNNNNWVELWRMNGNVSNAATKQFTRANVVIKENAYLYKGFQFRFRNHGRQSGPFDVWNIDHIYLNKSRTKNDIILDWGVSKGAHTFLKNHTAMPYEHFFADKANQSNSNQLLVIGNQSQNTSLYFTYANLYDQTNSANTLLYSSPNYASDIFSPYSFPDSFSVAMNYSTLTNTNEPRIINLYYAIQSQADTDAPYFGNNNYYTTSTILWNYYAYDDGTPEYAMKTSASGVSLAQRFGLSSIKDTLTHIDFCFTKNAGVTVADRIIFMTVWDASHNILHQEQINIIYPDPFYGFTRYTLSSPVYLAAGDSFYVGYTQNFTDPVFLGYDASINNANKVEFNNFGTWEKFSNESGYIPGSLMIRPVFDNGQILTSITDKENTENKPLLYPNPASDRCYVDGEVTQVEILDLLGRSVLLYENPSDGILHHELNIYELLDGMYLVQIRGKNGSTYTEKLLLRR